MRFRLGFVIGLGTGYYFGTKAGRERFEQIEELLSKAREYEAVGSATEKAKAAAGLGAEKAKDLMAKVRGDDTGDAEALDITDPPVDVPVVDAPTNGDAAVNPGPPTS